MGVATLLTLMLSYRDVSGFAPLAEAFQRTGFSGAKYIIICGGICATVSALFCAVYFTSRLVYFMAIDGLLFRCFSKVQAKTHVPGRAIIVSGIIMSLLAMIFEVNELVQLTCIGTLVAYTKVTISVLITRYQPGVQSVTDRTRKNKNDHYSVVSKTSLKHKRKTQENKINGRLQGNNQPSRVTLFFIYCGPVKRY